MTDTDHPTASSRPHITDMLHVALTTLPHGGTGGPEPQANEALAINFELGSRIGNSLSRLYHGGVELTATKKQANGGKRTYQVRRLHRGFRGEEGLHRPATFMVNVLRVAPVRSKFPQAAPGQNGDRMARRRPPPLGR